MRKIIKNNVKMVVVFIIGGLIFGTIGVLATYKYQATEVGYNPSNSNFKVDNVSDAIKELYNKCESNNSSTGLIGKIESSSNYSDGYMNSSSNDNNVVFGGYCWKIIRIKEGNKVRLIYNGIPTEEQCLSSGEETQIGTSKYSDDSTVTNYDDSMVKTVVDSWYSNNLEAIYANMIDEINLITRLEVSMVGEGGYLASGQQYWTQTPSGTNESTTGSCTINNPAQTYNNGGCSVSPSGEVYSSGIYTVDINGEIVNSDNGKYGGENSLTGSCSYCTTWLYYRGYTSSDYLCSQNYPPGYGCCYTSTYSGSCTASAQGSSLGVRPVITLKNNVELQGGQGTTSNPYYIK